jgi:hypothetical protein
MAISFKQLPIDILGTTWQGKLPPDVANAFLQMVRVIAERDLNLAILFSEIAVSGNRYTGTLKDSTATIIADVENGFITNVYF